MGFFDPDDPDCYRKEVRLAASGIAEFLQGKHSEVRDIEDAKGIEKFTEVELGLINAVLSAAENLRILSRKLHDEMLKDTHKLRKASQ